MSEERLEYEATVYVTFETIQGDAWRCLERSGIFIGAVLGETEIETIELERRDGGDL